MRLFTRSTQFEKTRRQWIRGPKREQCLGEEKERGHPLLPVAEEVVGGSETRERRTFDLG